MAELTPQLAQDSPEDFKAEVIEGLPCRSKYGAHLWSTVCRSGMIQIGNLHIESDTWVSRSNAREGYIHLGTQPLPKEQRERLLFDDAHIGYEDEVTMRLLHEVGHLFEAARISTGSDRIQDLLKTARSIRRVNQHLGLTAIGSLPFYGDDMRYHEDTAELLSMYAFNPAYLRRYCDFLGNPNNATTLNPVGVTVVPGYSAELFELVQSAVTETVSE